jgi:hypothetical protein
VTSLGFTLCGYKNVAGFSGVHVTSVFRDEVCRVGENVSSETFPILHVVA